MKRGHKGSFHTSSLRPEKVANNVAEFQPLSAAVSAELNSIASSKFFLMLYAKLANFQFKEWKIKDTMHSYYELT